MKRSPLILGILFLLLQVNADIETDFYHPAAAAYIQGDLTYANQQVMQGLEREPTQAKLLKLKELLEQQDDSSSDRSSEQNKDSSEDATPDQEEESSSSEQNTPPEVAEPSEQNTPEDASYPLADSTPTTPSLTEPMTQDEAQQLLDALREDEQDNRRKLRSIMGRPLDVEKDW